MRLIVRQMVKMADNKLAATFFWDGRRRTSSSVVHPPSKRGMEVR
jgi:hypothetical protein